MESYLEHFKSNTDYTNQQRISIFKSTFNSTLSDGKIGKIINQYFKVSSARIGGKESKVYQLADEYPDTEQIEEVNIRNNHNLKPEDKSVFLSEYNDGGISSIPFIMKLKTDTDYDVKTLYKLFYEAIGYKSDETEFKMIIN
jgi:hypothetical protein